MDFRVFRVKRGSGSGDPSYSPLNVSLRKSQVNFISTLNSEEPDFQTGSCQERSNQKLVADWKELVSHPLQVH